MKKAVSTLHKLNHVLLTAYYNGNLIIYLLYLKKMAKQHENALQNRFIRN